MRSNDRQRTQPERKRSKHDGPEMRANFPDRPSSESGQSKILYSLSCVVSNLASPFPVQIVQVFRSRGSDRSSSPNFFIRIFVVACLRLMDEHSCLILHYRRRRRCFFLDTCRRQELGLPPRQRRLKVRGCRVGFPCSLPSSQSPSKRNPPPAPDHLLPDLPPLDPFRAPLSCTPGRPKCRSLFLLSGPFLSLCLPVEC